MSVNVYQVRAAGPRGPGLSAADTAELDAAVAEAQAAQTAAETAEANAAASAVEFETFRDDTLSENTDVTRGVAAVVAGTANYSAGTWVLPVLTEFEETLLEFEFMTPNTQAGGLNIAHYTKSGATYTRNGQTAALDVVAQPTTNLFTTADFGSFIIPPGSYIGMATHGFSPPRRDLSNVSPVAWEYGGAGNLASFTGTANANFNGLQVRIKTNARELIVTATAVLELQAAVGINTSGDIILFADSLGTDTLGFVDELAALLTDRSVTGQPVGGQQAGSIALRTGGIEGEATVTGASIPASGGGVVVTGLIPDPFAASIGDPASFIVSLHDVPGVLSKSGMVYTFTRSDTGGAIPVTNPVKLLIRSTFVANTTGVGTTLLTEFEGRVGVLRDGHNDVFNDVIRDLAAYSRQAVKDYIAEQVEALGGHNRVIVCSITRGYSWLTAARVAALGLSGTITGWATDDAETIEAVIEAQALNQWMADTFPGYVDLMAAYEASSAGYITSINLGSSHVYKFANETILPDGTHGTDGGVEQTIAAQAVADKIEEMGL